MRPLLGHLVLYTKKYCGLCEEAKAQILTLQKTVPFSFEQVDIEAAGNTEWLRKYMYDIPVIHINGVPLMKHGVHIETLVDELNKEPFH